MSKLVSMEWDTSSINEEPMTIADILEEEREASDDAEGVCICIEDVCICSENPFEDEESQNFQAGEIRDILARLDAVSKELDDELDAISKELSDSEDEECLEVQAMVLEDYTEEELEDSESEDDMEQVANIEERDVIPEVISGLGPQITAQQKIQEWLAKMV